MSRDPFCCNGSSECVGQPGEPHRQLDGHYSSIDEAIADAIAWVEPLVDRHHPAALIGVEVSTTSGDWRTCRLPAALLCPLPRTGC